MPIIDKLLNWFKLTRPPKGASYRVFTREFDREVISTDLKSVLGYVSSKYEAELEEAWSSFSEGLQAWRTKAHLFGLEASERIKSDVDERALADTVVSILIDHSGSMRGQSIILAAAAADVSADFLCNLGVSVEILGFTTTSWKGGKARQKWLRIGKPRHPGRLCDLLHIIYRDADDRRPGAGGWNFKPMLRPDLLKENVDGEALEWAVRRLRARPERSKILLVVSDGAPVDDSTLLANDLNILDQHLKDVIHDIEASTDVRVAGLGIGFDVSRYYSSAVTIETAKDLGQAMLGLIEQILTLSPQQLSPRLHSAGT